MRATRYPACGPAGRDCAAPRRQRGAVAVMAAVWMLVAIVLLGAIDVGNVYFVRRDLQRVADIAALAAVQRMDDQCAQPTTTANSNAASNGFDPQASGNALSVACGRWDLADNASLPGYFGSAANQLNAVQVTASKTVPYFFLGPSRVVSATSTAKASNIDTFSLGTTLLMFGSTQDCSGNSISGNQNNTGLVNALLGALLNTSLSLDIGSYQALACTRIKVGDLMTALNVGTVDQLLATNVSLGKLVSAMVTALGTTSVANVNASASLTALNAIASANLPGTTIALGDTAAQPGLLSVGLANSQAAADATVSLLDMLFTAAEIANGNTKSPAVSVDTGLNLLGLASAKLQVQVIRPPTIAIGEGGTDPSKPATNPWRTSAHTADIAVYLNIGVKTWDLLSLLGISAQVQLPIYLEVAPGQAWLTSTSCAPTAAASRATITAQPGLLNLCVGDAPLNAQGMLDVSGGYSCSKTATIVNASLLGKSGLATVKVTAPAIPVPGVTSSGGALTFDGISGNSDDYQSVNSNAVGQVLTNALSGPIGALSTPGALTVQATLLGLPITIDATSLGTLLGFLTQTALAPILAALDQLLVPLLQLLGAQVGVATVHNMSLTCGVAQTVN